MNASLPFCPHSDEDSDFNWCVPCVRERVRAARAALSDCRCQDKAHNHGGGHWVNESGKAE